MTLRPEDWPRVKRVFDDALAREPAEWDAFLSRACAGDRLLLRQVETLLSAHRRAASFLESPASAVLDLAASGAAADSKIGPYCIARVLGRGGMGVVYAGVHETTGLPAAVKTVATPKADTLLRIRREIETLARLAHPGVVRILDYGVDRGRPWYAMELLEHSPLAEEGRRRPRHERLGLIQRLCETLAYVHGEGVVHGDLTPRNVLITERGLPVLVDFGLVARVGLASGREVLDKTRGAGSISYMAPEQIAGDLLDPRTDLYAVGVILYEALTGRVPFAGTVEEVIEQHRGRAPRPPSQLTDDVPDALDALVLHLLAKMPGDRVAYAIDVASALERLGAESLPPYVDPPVARPYLCRPPLVGRHAALDRLEATLSAAAAGSGALVLISGESGIGKTRLALEAARLAIVRGYQVVTGAATAALESTSAGRSEGPPLHPLIPLLQVLGDRCTEGGLDTSERLLGDRGPVLAAYVPSLWQVPGQESRPAPRALPAAHAQMRLFRYLADSVAAYAASTPTVLLLDDLQWADELTLGFLDYLARGRIATMPLVVIGSYRSDERHDTLASIAHAETAIGIALGRVSADDVAAMVSEMLSLAEPPKVFVQFLADRSEGNPYFVIEYLRMAVSERILVRNPRGQLVFSDGGDSSTAACESLPLPRSLREVVDRRVHRLSPLARRVVRCATVIGREFDAATIRAAVDLGDLEMARAVAEILDRQVAEITPAGRYRFTHDKLREVPYSALQDSERRTLHGQVAAAMERSTTPEDLDRMSASLGRHWSAAGERERAIPLLHRAGDQAVALHAVRDAIALYREAVANVESLGDRITADVAREAIVLREKLADALALTGAHAEARAELQRTLAAIDGDATLARARLQRKIGKTLEDGRDFDGALTAYAAAQELIGAAAGERPLAWQREWAQIQLRRAWVHYWKGQTEEMTAIIEQVGRYVRQPGLALERSLYYQVLGTRDLRRHRYVVPDECMDHARRALIAAAEANAAVEAVFARFMLGFTSLFRGELDEAERELDRARAVAGDIGDMASEVRCLAYLTITHRRAQRVDATHTWSRETVRAARAAGMSDYAAIGQAGLGWAAWKRGAHDEARGLCRAAINAWDHPAFPFPFQWIARLTLLATDIDIAALDELVTHISPLVDAAQMQLPDAMDRALREAVANHRHGHLAAAREALHRAHVTAARLGFV
jgi:eukaryotic-like serine/threonine-protein kinase